MTVSKNRISEAFWQTQIISFCCAECNFREMFITFMLADLALPGEARQLRSRSFSPRIYPAKNVTAREAA